MGHIVTLGVVTNTMQVQQKLTRCRGQSPGHGHVHVRESVHRDDTQHGQGGYLVLHVIRGGLWERAWTCASASVRSSPSSVDVGRRTSDGVPLIARCVSGGVGMYRCGGVGMVSRVAMSR